MRRLTTAPHELAAPTHPSSPDRTPAPPLPPARLPSITVAYQGLSVETDAAVGAAGIPSISRWVGLDALLSGDLLRRGGGARSTARLPIIRGIQGVLRPVRQPGRRILMMCSLVCVLAGAGAAVTPDACGHASCSARSLCAARGG